MIKNAQLFCIGRDCVEREFFLNATCERNGDLQVWVFSCPPQENGEFFYAAYSRIGEQRYRQTMIDNNGAEAYIEKGIPEVVLPFLVKTLSIVIESSPPTGGGPGVWQSSDGCKMWKRLADSGIAKFDPVSGVYVVA